MLSTLSLFFNKLYSHLLPSTNFLFILSASMPTAASCQPCTNISNTFSLSYKPLNSQLLPCTRFHSTCHPRCDLHRSPYTLTHSSDVFWFLKPSRTGFLYCQTWPLNWPFRFWSKARSLYPFSVLVHIYTPFGASTKPPHMHIRTHCEISLTDIYIYGEVWEDDLPWQSSMTILRVKSL